MKVACEPAIAQHVDSSCPVTDDLSPGCLCRILEDGKKVRYLVKTGEVIDS